MIKDVLDRSRQLGFLGPGSIDDQIEHSLRFGAVLDEILQVGTDAAVMGNSPVVADIGAGGGVPSLPLLVDRPWLQAVLIDASQRRCSFLVWACAELSMSDRVSVWCGRVEELAHEDRARATFDAVVARGFGPPATTAECGSGLLKVGGHLIVSEPPEGREWPSAAMGDIGLKQVAVADSGFAVFGAVAAQRPEVPRSSKIQQRRPLF